LEASVGFLVTGERAADIAELCHRVVDGAAFLLKGEDEVLAHGREASFGGREVGPPRVPTRPDPDHSAGHRPPKRF
jgi:hypothetical protein